jgi:hypothetical protein
MQIRGLMHLIHHRRIPSPPAAMLLRWIGVPSGLKEFICSYLMVMERLIEEEISLHNIYLESKMRIRY